MGEEEARCDGEEKGRLWRQTSFNPRSPYMIKWHKCGERCGVCYGGAMSWIELRWW